MEQAFFECQVLEYYSMTVDVNQISTRVSIIIGNKQRRHNSRVYQRLGGVGESLIDGETYDL